MGNILNDIVEEVNIKPNKTKLVLKWVISIASSLIVIAFTFGQFKSSFFSRMDRFEESLNKNTAAIEELKADVNKGFIDVNGRVDKVYNDAFEAFDEYQQFNKKQLILILDYGQSNKQMLKDMLELNMQEKTKSIENQLMQAKTEPVATTPKQDYSIQVKPMAQKDKEYMGMVYFIAVESNDTTFNVTAATMDFINKIDRSRYSVGAIVENSTYAKRYDFSYKNK